MLLTKGNIIKVDYQKASEMIAQGMMNKTIASIVGCAPSAISQIRRGFVKNAYNYENNVARFKESLEKDVVKTHNGCWVLTTSHCANGYSNRSFNGKSKSAHVASYIAYKGPIPKGMLVCHTCDIKICVNPAHLFLGTHKDNMQDASNKGRLYSGEQHHMSVLTNDLVKIMKQDYSLGFSFTELGFKYKVHRNTAKYAVTGVTWKHVH